MLSLADCTNFHPLFIHALGVRAGVLADEWLTEELSDESDFGSL
jgi:hypothetical protein